MAPLNRSQYLQGDANEGPVLAGRVQGVKKGAGVQIAADGTISIEASTAQGLIRTNNPTAFNGYTWPNADGEVRSFLSTDGAGNVTWEYASKSATVHIGPTPPNSPLPGQLWYNSNKRQLEIFENVDGANKWTVSHHGNSVDVEEISASPDFVAGDGTYDPETGGLPFVVSSENGFAGSVTHFGTAITISGLAPYQYVPIIDIARDTNGHRFGVSNNHADEDGNLTFRPTFHDFPASETSTAYTATYDIGFTGVFVSASMSIAVPLGLSDAGEIVGDPYAGELLTYTRGDAFGGAPPYVYSWTWRKASNSTIIQENGEYFTIPEVSVGDQLYVELKVVDSRNSVATLNTAFFPPPPEVVSKGSFPNTNILYPQFSNTIAETLWKDDSMTLYASGCVEFSIDDGSTWGQGARNIQNGDVIWTRWLETSDCLDRQNGTILEGCVFSNFYQDCEEFIIDKLPSPFTFNRINDVQAGSVVTSLTITPSGYNAKSYVTYSGSSDGTTIQGSLDGGATWANLPLLGTDTFPIEPGETLTVRMTVGTEAEKEYSAIINIGQGRVVQTAAFIAKVAAVTQFVTNIPFPVTTAQGFGSEPAPSVSWASGDGTTNLSATGCIEFRINGGAWGVGPSSISTGNTLETRWKDTASCGQAPHGNILSGTFSNGASKTRTGTITLDRVPADFSFAPVINLNGTSQVTSEVVSISGFNADAYLSINSGDTTVSTPQVSVNSGAFASIPALGGTSIVLKPTVPGNPRNTLQIRGTTGATMGQEYRLRYNAGNTTSSVYTNVWKVSTSDAVPTVQQPSIALPVNGSDNVNPNASSPPGVTLVSSAFVGLNGAGSHASSSWEIRVGGTGGSTVLAATQDTNNLTSIFEAIASFQPGYKYWARVRHHSSTGVASPWSNWMTFMTSKNFAIAWNRRFATSIAAGRKPRGLIWNGKLFLGCGAKGTFISSLDGKSWNVTKLPNHLAHANADFYGISYKNDKIFTCGDNGIFLVTQNDGVSWDKIDTVGASIVTQRSLAYGNGIFVSVGNSGVIQTSSDDCVTWNLRSSGTSATLEHVIFNNGMFYAVGGNVFLSSSNGVTWNVVNVPSAPDGRSLYRVSVSNGKFVATRFNSIYVERSSDGNTWERVVVADKVEAVQGGGVWFVTGGAETRAKFLSSVNDGQTWSMDYDDPSHINISAIAYAPELGRWAAIGQDFVAYSSV